MQNGAGGTVWMCSSSVCALPVHKHARRPAAHAAPQPTPRVSVIIRIRVMHNATFAVSLILPILHSARCGCGRRFTVGWAWMMIVGLGSFAFHATLRRYAQCMDELPMLYASITLFYNTLDHAPGPAYATPAGAAAAMRRQASESPWAAVQYRIGLKIVLVTCGTVLTYIYFQLPSLFQVFFLVRFPPQHCIAQSPP